MIKLKKININKLENEIQNENNLNLFKPLGLNFMTSFLMIVPIIHSLIREKQQLMIASSVCFITSLLNHGTYNKKIRKIDMIVNKICCIYVTFKCMYHNYYYYLSLIPVLFVVLGYCIFDISNSPKYGIQFHSLIHFVGNIGVCLMVETCFTEITCY